MEGIGKELIAYTSHVTHRTLSVSHMMVLPWARVFLVLRVSDCLIQLLILWSNDSTQRNLSNIRNRGGKSMLHISLHGWRATWLWPSRCFNLEKSTERTICLTSLSVPKLLITDLVSLDQGQAHLSVLNIGTASSRITPSRLSEYSYWPFFSLLYICNHNLYHSALSWLLDFPLFLLDGQFHDRRGSINAAY